eukprot:TRINITY_DN3960_c0_g1_i3.p1 TRINITY_DN3960_c0_g1~~TRINITY_DN3960_c0_g1_i3.p1  ORF type:complete len:511 (+),score=163.28 TRINITY_DN3960_c0_g1_i3:367-1899(+)
MSRTVAAMLSLNPFANLGWEVGGSWPGILLLLVGCVMANLGTNIMKLAINKRLSEPTDQRKRLSRTPQWLGGFAMFVVGTCLNFAAFKYAAQSLLSGLSSVQFLSQVLFSHFVLHEKVHSSSLAGVGAIIAGCILLVTFGTKTSRNYGPEELAALYGRSSYVCYLIMAAVLSVASWLAYGWLKGRIVRASNAESFTISLTTLRERQLLAALYSVRSALWGSQAVLLAKSLSMLLTQALHPSEAYGNPVFQYQTWFILAGFAAAATFWVVRLNHGLRLFEAVFFVPMMQVCWILLATVSGGIYFQEFSDWGSKQVAAYVLGFAVILGGVGLLCPSDEAQPLNTAEVLYDIVADDNADGTPRSPRWLAHPAAAATTSPRGGMMSSPLAGASGDIELGGMPANGRTNGDGAAAASVSPLPVGAAATVAPRRRGVGNGAASAVASPPISPPLQERAAGLPASPRPWPSAASGRLPVSVAGAGGVALDAEEEEEESFLYTSESRRGGGDEDAVHR